MKKQLTSIILVFSILAAFIVPAGAADKIPEKGKTISAFEVTDVFKNDVLNSDIVMLKHKKTGAQVMYIANDDTNRAFSIAFRTPAADTGISHVFEHATLSASEKYPMDIFFQVSSRTATTYINASTYMNMTIYPLSSISDKQLQKLSDYYLDAVFNPLILTNKDYFDTEAWRYEMTSPEDELTINGTVYSEMRGAMTPDRYAYTNVLKTLFPGSNKAVISGGDPDIIPSLTYEEVQQYHADYYIPSNSVSVIYGDVDYEAYLKLMDSYFSEFDDKKADTQDKNYTPIKGDVEKEFKLPGGSSTSVCYAIPFMPESEDDLFGMNICAVLLNDDASLFSQTMQEKFPNASVYAGVDMSAEPYFMIEADNLDASEKEAFKQTADEVIQQTTKEGFDSDIIDAIAAAQERNTLYDGQTPSNKGINYIRNIAYMWMVTDNLAAYLDNLDYAVNIKENAQKRGFENLMEKYILNSDRSALVVNIPDSNLAAEKEAALKEKLAGIKAGMTDEEITEIVKRSTEEKPIDTELEAKLMKEINVSSTSEMKAVLDNYKTKEYPYEETTEDNVRYLSANADIGDIGEGRIYLDISSLTDEQLLYLQLISDMTGEFATANYSQPDFSKLLSRYFAGSDKFLPADDKMYYTYSFVTLNDDIDETYDVLYELLFEQDFTDTDTIASIIEYELPAYESAVVNNPSSFIVDRALAAGSEKQAVYNYLEGLDYYKFLKNVKSELSENPEAVTEKLNETVAAMKNKSGAVTIFAGNDEGIKQNDEAAKAFWSEVPYEEKAAAERNIPVPDKSEGIIIDSTLNYNIEAAPLSVSGVDRDGKFTVTSELMNDKLLTPQLRYVKGAYGVMYNTNEYGTYICSYRDPQLGDTFDFYGNLSELLGGIDITQDDIDDYIISCFVKSANLRGELEDAWHFLSTKVYTSEKELYDKLSEMLDTTPQKAKEFASVYKNVYEKGVKMTIGKEGDIIGNADLFDKILIPFGDDEIYIYVDNSRVETDTAPVIKNDRTLVPIRFIAEALGARVYWTEENQSVLIMGDYDYQNISLNIGSDEMNVHGDVTTLDVAPEIMNERTMVPLRAISEAFGKEVLWKTGAIVIR